jgi:hypothetical protein
MDVDDLFEIASDQVTRIFTVSPIVSRVLSAMWARPDVFGRVA